MKVHELIKLLQTMPQDKDVGYVNNCADDGREFVFIDEANERANRETWYGGCTYPDKGVVVLS